MKFRNQLIAAACLLAFAGLGALYIRMWVVQKPRQIILFVSDALATRPLAAARLYAGGAAYKLELERFPHTALLRNASEEFAVPDTASAATALATGHRTRHRAVAATGKGRAFDTILEKARSEGRAIGLVTNTILTAPSAAAFYAHTARPEESDGIALQLFEREWMKVVLGGGRTDFQPEGEGGRRKDGRDLVAEWQAKGVQVVRSKAELETAQGGDSGRVVGLFSAGALAFANQMESGSEQPSLADMTRRAIDLLKNQRVRSRCGRSPLYSRVRGESGGARPPGGHGSGRGCCCRHSGGRRQGPRSGRGPARNRRTYPERVSSPKTTKGRILRTRSLGVPLLELGIRAERPSARDSRSPQ